MKIRYEYATGEITEIEIDEVLGAEIAAIELTEARRERAETRRHTSYDSLLALGAQISDGSDLQTDYNRLEDRRRLLGALSSLEPQQRSLIDRLFVHGERITDIARDEGVSKSAICRRLDKIFARLRKKLSEGG